MRKKILLIDDMPFNIRLMRQILEDEGYEVFAICDNITSEVIDTICEINPSIIILDIMMPGISGHEICRLVKRHDKLKSIPVIMLTAMADELSIKQSFDAGACGYISKPFDEDKVIELIKETERLSTDAANSGNVLHSIIWPGCNGSFSYHKFEAENVFKKLGRDMEFFKQIVDTFEESSMKLLQEIGNSLKNMDKEKLVKDLHALKSLVLYVNADKAKDMIMTLDADIKAHRIENINSLFDAIEKEIRDIILILKNYMMKVM